MSKGGRRGSEEARPNHPSASIQIVNWGIRLVGWLVCPSLIGGGIDAPNLLKQPAVIRVRRSQDFKRETADHRYGDAHADVPVFVNTSCWRDVTFCGGHVHMVIAWPCVFQSKRGSIISCPWPRH